MWFSNITFILPRIVAWGLSNASDTSSAASKERLYPPFVPSKRIIEHHEYQNIKEEAAQERDADKAPVLRRFGDTNVLKNKKT